MSSVSAIALSGMTAAARRLEVSARNVANVRSAGPTAAADPAIRARYPAAFVPWRVDMVETMVGGVQPVVREVSPPDTPVYDPRAPYADASGMVAMPNVDLAGESLQQRFAAFDHAVHALILRLYGDMTKSLLDIKA